MHFTTITTKNWIYRGITTLESIKRYHPDATFSVLVLHDPFEVSLPKHISVVWGKDIGVQELEYIMYNPYELSCAIRPRLIRYLFNQFNFKVVWHIDSDVLFFGALPRLPSDYDIYLTAHLLNFKTSILMQEEIGSTLSFGVWNGGLIGFNDTPDTRSFLDLWDQLMYKNCIRSPHKICYLDQSWLNIVTITTKAYILKNQGINVGYWNIHERVLSRDGDKIHVGGEPLIAWHFSSYNKDTLYPRSLTNYRPNKMDEALFTQLTQEYEISLKMQEAYQFTEWQYITDVDGISLDDNVRSQLRHLWRSDAVKNVADVRDWAKKTTITRRSISYKLKSVLKYVRSILLQFIS